MSRYVALLRGINVGGNNLIKMAALKACFEANGFDGRRHVHPERQRAVLVAETRTPKLAAPDRGDARRRVRLRGQRGAAEPQGDAGRRRARAEGVRRRSPTKYRYDVIFLKAPLTAAAAIKAVPTKPGVDEAHAGAGVLYFSRLISKATAEPPRQDRLVADLQEHDDPQLEHDHDAAALMDVRQRAQGGAASAWGASKSSLL